MYDTVSLYLLVAVLRVYAINNMGTYIAASIAKRMRVIRSFLTDFGNNAFQTTIEELTFIIDFLAFIRTPEATISWINERIRTKREPSSGQRQLKNLMNYLVIQHEIEDLFENGTTEEKIKYFPIYFWVKITFVIPLRATEMIVTPYPCVTNENGDYYFRIRRTLLKGGNTGVYNDVKKDYRVEKHKIPNDSWINTIYEIFKYQKLTEDHERRFLFDYNDCPNDMFSLLAFNNLLEVFMEERIIGSPKYDFAKKMSNIDDFEVVTAGDSRPIAMSNIYFQGFSPEICRDLAGHVSVNTSEGYYTNVGQTIMCSSIINAQNRYERKKRTGKKILDLAVTLNSGSFCTSEKVRVDRSNYDDCKEHGNILNCFGCKYHPESREELEKQYWLEREKVEEYHNRALAYLNEKKSLLKMQIDLESDLAEMLDHYRKCTYACDKIYDEEFEKWVEKQNLMKI